MIYVIEGQKKLDEVPTYQKLVDGTAVTVHESDKYDGDCVEKFKTTEDYYEWGMDNIDGFGKTP